METIDNFLSQPSTKRQRFEFQYTFILAKHENPNYGGKNDNKQPIFTKTQTSFKAITCCRVGLPYLISLEEVQL